MPRQKVALYENVDGTFRVNMSRVFLKNACDPFEFTKGSIEGRKQIQEIISMMRRCIPGCENISLVQSAFTLGIRESRRIQGDFVLTGDDIKKKMKFDDVIFLSGNSIDMHSGILSITSLQMVNHIKFHTEFYCRKEFETCWSPGAAAHLTGKLLRQSVSCRLFLLWDRLQVQPQRSVKRIILCRQK